MVGRRKLVSEKGMTKVNKERVIERIPTGTWNLTMEYAMFWTLQHETRARRVNL